MDNIYKDAVRSIVKKLKIYRNTYNIRRPRLIFEAALDEKYLIPSLTRGIITVKTRDQIVELLEEPYYEIVPQAAIATDNTFSATFDTTVAQPGTYTVKANDGYGYTAATSVAIIEGATP